MNIHEITIQSTPTVALPNFVAGQKTIVIFTSGSKLVLPVNPAEMSAEREGSSLTLVAENGGQVMLKDFFMTNPDGLPVLVLPDGTEIESASVLFMLEDDMSVNTSEGFTMANVSMPNGALGTPDFLADSGGALGAAGTVVLLATVVLVGMRTVARVARQLLA